MENLIHEKFRTGTDKTTTNKYLGVSQSGVCPPCNFVKADSQWAKCTNCGQIIPIYNMRVRF